MKSLDDTKPQSNNSKWEDNILWHELPKDNEWYGIRIVGGTFSYANHWIAFTNDKGQEKKFPVGCSNWNQDTESADLDNGCLPCKLGIPSGTRYLLNVIDRRVQADMRAGHNPIRVLNLPPTAVNKIIALKKLNIHENEQGEKETFSVADSVYGCDLWIQWNTQGKKEDWQFQKGDACPLTDEEQNYELFDFDSIYKLPDPRNVEASLKRVGLLEGSEETAPKKIVSKKPVVKVPEDDTPAEEETPKPAPAPKKPVTAAAKPAVKPPVEEEPQEEEEVVEEAPQKAPPAPKKPVAPVAPSPAPKSSTAPKLGAPPAANQGKVEKPACYGKYLGGIKCIKCAYKTQCSNEASSTDEE